MKKKILVVAAHGDDEVLGCGGTMARHAAEGDEVHLLLLADGETSRGSAAGIPARNEAVDKAGKILDVSSMASLGLPDNKMDSLPLLDIVQRVEKEIRRVRPQVIYTHHGGDLNIDHRITHQAVLTACRPLPGSEVEAIYGFEVLSSTEWASLDQPESFFRPIRFVDIASYLDKKLEALRCYDAEMRDFPHARSYEAVDALAKLRGAQSGLMAAEAFTVLRQIIFR